MRARWIKNESSGQLSAVKISPEWRKFSWSIDATTFDLLKQRGCAMAEPSTEVESDAIAASSKVTGVKYRP